MAAGRPDRPPPRQRIGKVSNGREQGLYGSEVELADGTTVTADAAYVEESLADPGARVVDGYNHIMPAYEPRPGEVYALVAYLRTLTE